MVDVGLPVKDSANTWAAMVRDVDGVNRECRMVITQHMRSRPVFMIALHDISDKRALQITHEVWDLDELQRRLPYLSTTSYFPPRTVEDEQFGQPTGQLSGGLFTPHTGRPLAAFGGVLTVQLQATWMIHSLQLATSQTQQHGTELSSCWAKR